MEKYRKIRKIGKIEMKVGSDFNSPDEVGNHDDIDAIKTTEKNVYFFLRLSEQYQIEDSLSYMHLINAINTKTESIMIETTHSVISEIGAINAKKVDSFQVHVVDNVDNVENVDNVDNVDSVAISDIVGNVDNCLECSEGDASAVVPDNKIHYITILNPIWVFDCIANYSIISI